ncbi:LOW QUALITY PROTEIN: 5'-3' exoribonuclease 2-like [Brevipalpus obovatus]|uniref:LOW QUALITY PROTEIN: 5'-3' exoribonuclease 2-like n=1 Tax=Brevipalpus obovatus TaxID=246614 RepID=UPI003D9F4560
MGVPAFFRWLSKKYPSIVVEVDPNVEVEYVFDNLYLDMNGIIHPCTHPEYKQAPETEEEMFDSIFEYIDKLLKIMKPRKLLYMVVDGVAPRAKMNQQKSRRFRAAKESVDKKLEIQKIKEDLRSKGMPVEEGEKKAHFDSNVITPGTPFMINLSKALQAWIDKKFDHSQNDEESNKLWHKDLIVILSDASSPGEGEHKIMEYIRRQKSQPDYDPNISHCLCGADADLIMLGLATHELNFTIIREEFIPNQPKPCEICGQYNHEMKECEGKPADPTEEVFIPVEPGFIFIRLNVLREYLEIEAKADNLDLERFIDDFVFLCFFVGNDFLPHLPSLEIREGAIDRLVKLYKSVIKRDSSDCYMTKNGIVNLKRVQPLLHRLGELEDDIFRRRSENDKRFRKRIKNERENKAKQAERIRQDAASGSPWLAPQVVGPRGQKPDPMAEPRTEAYHVRMMHGASSSDSGLKSMLREEGSEEPERKGTKRPHSDSETGSEDSEIDEVMLGSAGWKERYYYHKFDTPHPDGISEIIAKEYVIGFCWVLLYYYQGCPDWQWFYPFHYAPFASDFKDIADVEVKFNRKSTPFQPLKQLMSVFPAASSKSIPDPWKRLMMDPQSKIIDFYPETFKIDLNGKMQEWQGVALLPFIDEERLHQALKPLRSLLDDSERERNSLGPHLVFISKKNSEAYHYLDLLFDGQNSEKLLCDPEKMDGLAGAVKHNKKYSHHNSRCVEFFDPIYEDDFIFPAKKFQC